MSNNQPPVEAIQGEAMRAKRALMKAGGHPESYARHLRDSDQFPLAEIIPAMLAFQSEARGGPSASLPHQADREAIARVREAAQSVIDNAVSSYRSRGKDHYIEDDSGEKMMLVPHDDWYALQQALLPALSPTPSATLPPATEKAEK